MASRSTRSDASAKYCEDCGDETPHRVSIDLVAGRIASDGATDSREPRQVAECIVCSSTTSARVDAV